MIFVLHYLLFNAGLSTVIVLLTLFLQTYSSASMSEIGTLLMVLPFLSIVIKPLFCALADRHQAHKQYLMGALSIMIIGYGSLIWSPFYPEFVEQHGQLVWYLDVIGILVGYCAFGVVWSLGDALAVNGAQMNGVSWGSYRVWGVVSWGGLGIVIGQINELPFLPKYVPAFFVLILSLFLEIVLLAFWPNKHFVMGGSLKKAAGQMESGSGEKKQPADLEPAQDLSASGCGDTLVGSRSNPRLVGRVASLLMEDLGGSLRSSLRLGNATDKSRRVGLEEILGEHEFRQEDKLATKGGGVVSMDQVAGTPPSASALAAQLRRAEFAKTKQLTEFPPSSLQSKSPLKFEQQLADLSQGSGTKISSNNCSDNQTPSSTLGRRWRSRTQRTLSRMNTLGASGGHVFADEVSLARTAMEQDWSRGESGKEKRMQSMYMSSLASNSSLARATAAAAAEAHLKGAKCDSSALEPAAKQEEEQVRRGENLQLILLKLIIRRDPNIRKFLLLFTLFGLLLIVHLSYFFLHLEQLCRQHQVPFSSVTGGMLAAHSVSEVVSFTLVVPYYVPRVGRCGALLTCATVYAFRFLFYGTYYVNMSPYYGVPFELCHGIAYGIVYSLITDIACECVDQVDDYLPELVQRGILTPDADPNQLKLPLRATMQGVFSGAFDGLGNGFGALFGGLFLDAYSFTTLWKFSAYLCFAIIIFYPLSEWRSSSSSNSNSKSKSKSNQSSPPGQMHTDQQPEKVKQVL